MAKRSTRREAAASASLVNSDRRSICPVVIYPFKQPRTLDHIDALFRKLKSLQEENPAQYSDPIVVVNYQTQYRSLSSNPEIANAFNGWEDRVKPNGEFSNVDVLRTWAVDTCQMWLAGLGAALEKTNAARRVNDVYWLIPGDFHYNHKRKDGLGALAPIDEMSKIPQLVLNAECELALGEIDVDPNSAKQLIDTYGTYGLLYNWFPAEAQGIRRITDKPRTEFFAISHDFLNTALVTERWYGYEQTLIILLQNMRAERTVRTVKSVKLGKIEDDPSARSTLASAMQQVERTERVLKQFWRELNEQKHTGTWPDTFRKLDAQSEQIRGAAMTIMQQLLG